MSSRVVWSESPRPFRHPPMADQSTRDLLGGTLERCGKPLAKGGQCSA
ncbi:MAG TPA: hypothetical protein VG713_13540 [Pirellulales bacterium]|nr:hypothetical protein [Pirellulales bacterium]